ncbi:MAG: FtsX-like permease family protein [Azoarcus sp.]|nr:FtsX-like permease family protein [Azoarcus sp.]
MNLKLALLNLTRNTRRTLLSVITLVLAMSMVLIFQGFVESMFDGLREGMIRSQFGHLQVFPQGYNQFGALNDANMLFTETQRVELMDSLQKLPHAEIVTARLESDLLITNDYAQMSVHVTGTDPDKESVLSSAIQIIEGAELFPADRTGILLGGGLAAALGAKVGDELTLLGNSVHQTINAIDVVVRGIVTTGTAERDLRAAFTNIGLMEDFLLTKGATRIVVLLDDTAMTDAARAEAEKMLAAPARAIEIKTWSELSPYYHQVVGLFSAVFLFVQIILLLVAGLAVSNAITMSIVERTREIGVIRAIGGDPLQICKMFFLEGSCLGAISALLGIPLVLVLSYLINHSGVMMPTPPGSTVNYPMRIMLDFRILAAGFASCILVALAASVVPALKTIRMNVMEALNHV